MSLVLDFQVFWSLMLADNLFLSAAIHKCLFYLIGLF